MAARRFAQVDVFHSSRCSGNPVAAVIESEGLTTRQMQAFARWMNLSETTFLLPPTRPEADYRLRIFTPAGELPFAGHPTLGSAHAWLEHGGRPRLEIGLIQECAAGLIEVRRRDEILAFAAPPVTRTGPLEPSTLSAAIAAAGVTARDVVDHQWGVNGPRWAVLALRSADAVRAAEPVATRLRDFDLGLVGPEDSGSPYAYEVRAIVAPPAPAEDPVTGSLNAAIAQWLRREGRVPTSYLAHQGSQVGAAGEITVTDDGTAIWIGGRTSTLIRGKVRI